MQKDLTKGSALKNIITFSLPFLLANFLQTFYGMADLFIVGQYNGAASLSGVSIGSQVMHMITVMLVGIAMGSTVMIGRYVGERKEEEFNEDRERSGRAEPENRKGRGSDPCKKGTGKSGADDSREDTNAGRTGNGTEERTGKSAGKRAVNRRDWKEAGKACRV